MNSCKCNEVVKNQ